MIKRYSIKLNWGFAIRYCFIALLNMLGQSKRLTHNTYQATKITRATDREIIEKSVDIKMLAAARSTSLLSCEERM